MATISEALAIALQHHQAGRLEAAEQIYQRILQVEPEQPDALHFLGVLNAQLGRPETAAAYIARAITVNPNAAPYHLNLGRVYQESQKLDEAIACYRRALQLQPDFVEVHFNVGNALREQGLLGEAVDCYRRAVELKPDFAEAHNNLGVTFFGQGKLAEAATCCRRALQLRPDFADAYYNLGNALKDLGELDGAIVSYRRAIDLKPDCADAYGNLGSVFWRQGKLDDAIACCRRALQLMPDNAEANNNLGAAFEDQGKMAVLRAGLRERMAASPLCDGNRLATNLMSILQDVWEQRIGYSTESRKSPHFQTTDSVEDSSLAGSHGGGASRQTPLGPNAARAGGGCADENRRSGSGRPDGMRLLFVDPLTWDYNIESVYQQPLGGSQSALCYLAGALASRGHHVSLLTNTTTPGLYRGVRCMAASMTTPEILQSLKLDACIVLNGVLPPSKLRADVGPAPLLVLWTGHAPDMPVVQHLADPAVCDGYDRFVFVSNWQRSQYLRKFPIKHERSIVCQNAVAPAFEGMFPSGASICREKSMPPVLAYTSTPFRGLKVLLEVFPEIRAALPGTRLKVYSSMKVYQFTEDADAHEFGALYRACRETEGVEYCGSIAQSQLANELRRVAALTYPNTFAETSCIAVMEAMAAGCGIVTSDLGALPETTAGFGSLISMADGKAAYCQRFRDAVITLLEMHLRGSDSDIEERLRRQVDFANTHYTWTQRARDWETWLAERLIAISPRASLKEV
jgi:tetratricopeptide (TPR) repeat protein/glycosyltransferase involved in cell wall biosynthesis